MTRPRALAAPALLCLSLLLAASGCGSDFGTSADQGYVAGKGVITLLADKDRTKPGKVSGETLEGDPVALSSYAGKVVVVNVWGSWCPPCRSEAADLAAAARALAPKGVVFLGIDTKDTSRDNALSFQRSRKMPYPSLYDPDGRTLLAFRGTLRPNSIPSTVIIDRQGRVAASILGEVTSRQTLIDLVEDVSK